MKSNTYNLIGCLVFAFVITGCDPSFSDPVGDGPDPDAGSADFSSFVAVGDSLTAGYGDGALYRHAQINSLPAILAQQFALAGGGEFDQPLLSAAATGSLTHTAVDLGRIDRLVLVSTGNPSQPAAPGTVSPVQSTAIDTRLTGAGFFNNIGVPGAKSFHVIAPGYGESALAAFLAPTANPYFARFAFDDTASMLDDALRQAPTFFTFWIGANDILLFALDGNDAAVSGQSITPTGTFDFAFSTAITALTANPETKGVLINIPQIDSIPYFTTVPFNSIPLDQATADTLNAVFAGPYNAVITASAISPAEKAQRNLNFVAGMNPVVIVDDDLTPVAPVGNLRFATANDFILLPASTKIGVDSAGQYGITVGLANLDVLTENEAAAIEAARVAYNTTIEATANANPNLLLYDAAADLVELNTTGINYGSGGISSTFGQGGGFSLDGVHPTARGYAVVANRIIDLINEGFGATLPPVDPNEYTTVFYQ